MVTERAPVPSNGIEDGPFVAGVGHDESTAGARRDVADHATLSR